jgi:phage terminase large subunit
VIDYYENNRKLTDHYIQMIQNRGYTYSTHWLPHDAKSNAPGVERTVERQLKDAGLNVKLVPDLSVADGINAARTIFPVSYFDKERCDQGIKRLRAYRYGLDERRGRWTRVPIHDTSSHAADAWRYAGVALRGDDPAKPKKPLGRVLNLKGSGQSWMGV